MLAGVRQLADWVDDRTGVATAFRRFLDEDIPASAGWPHVFGGVAAFLFLTQAITGILLALNYAPTPVDAYHSLRYIIREVAAGRMIRGLHHWGSSAMIIVVFVHMAQVFLSGAFKKPREATWMIGVVLLLLTLAFGLTGYLLPWDNRAYWGTVVTTQIMASVPVVGALLVRLAGAANGIGVVTFARFYTLHTVLLPAAMVALVLVHVYLVRRHGITPAASDRGPRQKFYPEQVFRDMAAVFVAFVLLFAAAAFLDVPLERLADPTDTSYVPRPEWYFLFLFELLKIFQGSLEVIGTVLLPSITVILLFAVPFIRVPRLRAISMSMASVAVVVVVFTAWAGLTAAAIWSTPNTRNAISVPQEAAEWAQLPSEEIAGIGYFHSSHCDSCHNLLKGEPKSGPNLAAIDLHHSKEWLVQHFTAPQTVSSTDVTKHNKLSLPQLNALSLFTANLRPDSVTTLQDMSPQFIKGAQLYVSGACGTCHKVNSLGGGIGPPLNGLANRRTAQWVKAHFSEPRKLSPGSIMPAYHFTQPEEEAILLYLFSLPE